MKSTAELDWKKYVENELLSISTVLTPLGFTLDDTQHHISGERYLSDRQKVVIKISNHPNGKKEIETEKKSRDTLSALSFASDSILFPKEILYINKNSYLIFVTEFIEQNKKYLDKTLEEQFFLILRAFESQESFHATTFEHVNSIKRQFPIQDAKYYIESTKSLIESINKKYPHTKLHASLLRAQKLISSNEKLINKYSNYLAHTDFVPHNFRLKDDVLYMLDASAVVFGNKYEGWARFLNYMALHNPVLCKILLEYIKKNRDDEENSCLQIMRVYKNVFLLSYHVTCLEKTSGDLRTLTEERIQFWNKILDCILDEREPDQSLINSYTDKRNSLRSQEEIQRQKNL